MSNVADHNLQQVPQPSLPRHSESRKRRTSEPRPSEEAPDRLPPQSLEMECATLGAMIMDRAARKVVREVLEQTDFYRVEHGLVFRAIGELEDEGSPVDLISLQDALRRKDLLEQVGGVPFLVNLLNTVGSCHNARYYAEQVMELAARRALVGAFHRLHNDAFTQPSLELIREVLALEEHPVIQRRRAIGGQDSGLVAAAQIPVGSPPARVWFGMYAGSVILLIGETGSGKSSLLYNVALNVALGTDFCGFGPDEGRQVVLYVDPENAGNWHEGQGGVCGLRLDRIGLGRPDNLYFHSGEGLDLSQPASMLRLQELVTKLQARLVILDPIANLFRTDDENSNAEAARQMRFLTELSRKSGACVVACHHTGKDDPGHYGRGASARLAASDVGMVLRSRTRRPSDGGSEYGGCGLQIRTDVCKLEIVKNRIEGKGTLYLVMLGDDRFGIAAARDWDTGGQDLRVAPTRRGRAVAAMTAVLADGRKHRRQEVLDAATRFVSTRTAERILTDLLREGRIHRQLSGDPADRILLWMPDPTTRVPSLLEECPDEEDDPFSDTAMIDEPFV